MYFWSPSLRILERLFHDSQHYIVSQRLHLMFWFNLPTNASWTCTFRAATNEWGPTEWEREREREEKYHPSYAGEGTNEKNGSFQTFCKKTFPISFFICHLGRRKQLRKYLGMVGSVYLLCTKPTETKPYFSFIESLGRNTLGLMDVFTNHAPHYQHRLSIWLHTSIWFRKHMYPTTLSFRDL